MKKYSGDFEKDARAVRRLAQVSFGHHSFAGGIYPADRDLNLSLCDSEIAVPDELGMPAVRVFVASVLKASMSEAYLKKFREQCILQKMALAHGRTEPVTVGSCARRIEENIQREE